MRLHSPFVYQNNKSDDDSDDDESSTKRATSASREHTPQEMLQMALERLAALQQRYGAGPEWSDPRYSALNTQLQSLITRQRTREYDEACIRMGISDAHYRSPQSKPPSAGGWHR